MNYMASRLLTSFSWYQGLHGLVTGKARELKLYLVDDTGTLPSVSPLNHTKKIKVISTHAT